ncbi:unnamed protein product [Blepharisma stoltei]|uniref:RING finger protein 141 n=1 Tax=Blepharisma stoltei TaxID=1481888 RepID=A0AAU9JW10_9CILI|nr:unnamed protein product [Blepharisma stoltei]
MGNSYQNFKGRLSSINEYTQSKEFTKYSGKILFFHVKAKKINEYVPVFWKLKGFIRISVYEIGEESDPRRSLKKKLSISNTNRIYELLMHMKFASSLSPTTMLNENECSICLERLADTILPCHHSFCHRDIHEWEKRQNTCPICRRPINLNNSFTDLAESFEDIQNEIDNCLSEIISLIN